MLDSGPLSGFRRFGLQRGTLAVVKPTGALAMASFHLRRYPA
jgi:hypothetical protein